jgi:hypothetical protein
MLLVVCSLQNGNECGEKEEGDENLKAIIRSTDCDRPKTTGDWSYFSRLGSMITNNSIPTRESKLGRILRLLHICTEYFAEKLAVFELEIPGPH